MTTGFLYSMGCSIIHLALLITLFIIKKPNLAETARIDNDYNQANSELIKSLNFTNGGVNLCQNEAEMYYLLYYLMIAVHIFCMGVGFYREIADASNSGIGLIMKLFELIGTMSYLFIVITCLMIVQFRLFMPNKK